MENYDLAVVGAGPSGLMAARKAAESGIKVLLLEKERGLGMKACGEAVSKATIVDAEVQPSQKFICNHVKGAYVYAPDERKRIGIFGRGSDFSEGYILDKAAFLRELAYLAVQKGVDLWIKSDVLDVIRETDGSYVVKLKRLGEVFSVKSKIVLGCDGVNSVVVRKFFKRSNYEVIPCVQYKMVNCRLEDTNILEFYIGREVAPLGYVWIFPKYDGLVNVGIGVRGTPAKPYLDKFTSSHQEKFKDAKIIEIQSGVLPISGQIEKIVEGSVMVCGDAAGQVIPLTGGGIHSSIVAGKIAGGVSAEAVLNGHTDLNEYPKRYVYWSERIRKSLIALKVAEKLKDEEINQLTELLTGEDIIDLANGLNISRVWIKLFKHPYFGLRITKALMG